MHHPILHGTNDVLSLISRSPGKFAQDKAVIWRKNPLDFAWLTLSCWFSWRQGRWSVAASPQRQREVHNPPKNSWGTRHALIRGPREKAKKIARPQKPTLGKWPWWVLMGFTWVCCFYADEVTLLTVNYLQINRHASMTFPIPRCQRYCHHTLRKLLVLFSLWSSGWKCTVMQKITPVENRKQQKRRDRRWLAWSRLRHHQATPSTLLLQ